MGRERKGCGVVGGGREGKEMGGKGYQEGMGRGRYGSASGYEEMGSGAAPGRKGCCVRRGGGKGAEGVGRERKCCGVRGRGWRAVESSEGGRKGKEVVERAKK